MSRSQAPGNCCVHQPVEGGRLVKLVVLAGMLLLAQPRSAGAQSAEGRPFRTLAAAPLPAGTQALDVGAEYRTSVNPEPLLGEAEGDLLGVPELRYRIGFGRAELDFGVTGWRAFSDDLTGEDEEEVGDIEFSTTVAIFRQKGGRPGMSFAVGAKLPNASDETGLGTDESDVFGSLLLGYEGRTHAWRFNVGLAILGDPLEDASQEDMLTYGIAGRHGGRHAFIWEIWGRAFDSDDHRDLEESTARAGYLYKGRRATFDIALLKGLTDNSGDLGASTGATWRFGGRR